MTQPEIIAPSPPVVRTSRRGALVAGYAVGLVLLLAASVAGTLWVVADRTTAAADPIVTPSSLGGAAPAATAQPLDLVLAILRRPLGTRPLTAPVGSADGRVSVDQAAAHEYDDPREGRSYLLSMGYVEGAEVSWKGPAVNVQLLLYRYDLTTHCRNWMFEAMTHMPYKVDTLEQLRGPACSPSGAGRNRSLFITADLLSTVDP